MNRRLALVLISAVLVALVALAGLLSHQATPPPVELSAATAVSPPTVSPAMAEDTFVALLAHDADLTSVERADVLGSARSVAVSTGRKVCQAEQVGAELSTYQAIVQAQGAHSMAARLYWPIVDAAVAPGSLCPGAGEQYLPAGR